MANQNVIYMDSHIFAKYSDHLDQGTFLFCSTDYTIHQKKGQLPLFNT